MSATSTARKRNGSAPESAPATTDAPAVESAPVIDISADVESAEEIKRVRVYTDSTQRAPMPSGKLATVQREKFADGSEGPFLLAVVTITRDKQESVQRVDLAQLQETIDALAAVGVYVVRDRRS